MIEAATFTCSICSEPSTDICVSCTKDACWNHRCERCKRCSDCCECDLPLTPREPQRVEPVVTEPVPTQPVATHLSVEPVMPEPGIAAESIPELFLKDKPGSEPADSPLPETDELDSSWLTPPEATEEPDLNTPPAPVIKKTAEPAQPEEKIRLFPTNSAHDGQEGAD